MKNFQYKTNKPMATALRQNFKWGNKLLLKWVFIGSLSLLPLIPAAGSAEEISIEDQIKAALLHKFILFVEWPDSVLHPSQDFIHVCTLGKSSINTAIDALQKEQAKGQNLKIRHFQTLQEMNFCHVLFVGKTEKYKLQEIRRFLGGRSTLTVGDSKGFTEGGGMISFAIVNKKVRYEINLDVVREANLKISSKLLRLARIVRTQKQTLED